MTTPALAARLSARNPLTALLAGLMSLGIVFCGSAHAEPAGDAAVSLDDLAGQSEQLATTINAAQQDLDHKLRLVAEADNRQANDLAALDAAKARLAAFQGAVDRLASAVYMSGRSGADAAVLTAVSPTDLIRKLSVTRVMGMELAEQMQGHQRAAREAQTAATAAAVSAVQAKAVADKAGVLRADLRRKQSELQVRINQAKARYALLHPTQQRAQAPSAAVVKALGMMHPIPTVGMAGVVPNARNLANYIMATYPGVRSIGGVRADPIPDHPSGHAIDIMIGSDMGLGDVILADIHSQAARFGLDYTLWRVAAHYDHIHVRVN